MSYSGDERLKVIIFDWDDTICPSSFYDRQQMENMDALPESVSCNEMFLAVLADLLRRENRDVWSYK